MRTAIARQRNGGRTRRWRRARAVAAAGAALALLALGGRPAAADGAWLDQRPPATWNAPGAAMPQAPPRDAPNPRPPQGRAPQSAEDYQVQAAGWTSSAPSRAATA